MFHVKANIYSDPVGLEGVVLKDVILPSGATQQVADEQVVPGEFADHAHVQPLFRVGAGFLVDYATYAQDDFLRLMS